MEQLPHSGFDAAGGAGHKAFIELQYAKPDPTLHTQLFAKFPWDYFESDTGRQYRMQISTYGDMDSAELLTSICCEHLPRGGVSAPLREASRGSRSGSRSSTSRTSTGTPRTSCSSWSASLSASVASASEDIAVARGSC